MIALPPFDTGAVKVTLAGALPLVAIPMVGAPGTVGGMAKAGDNHPNEMIAIAKKTVSVRFIDTAGVVISIDRSLKIL